LNPLGVTLKQNSKIRAFHQSCAGIGAIAAILLLASCTPKQQTVRCNPPAADSKNSQGITKTSDIQLSLLIDGTPSMEGYVKNSNSNYLKTFQLLDSASSTGWSSNQTNITYFRFGSKKQTINRETFLRAQLPGFYQGGAEFNVSRIDTVLTPPKANTLNIIVTDLYQKDADVQLVQNILKKEYLEAGYAIGVLAIKSEFNGTIYDVGLSGQSFAYSTAGKAATAFHPFYVMVLGSYGNVQHFFEQLNRSGLTSVPHQFMIFYPQLVAKAGVLNPEILKKDLPKGINPTKSLNDGRVVLRREAQDPVQFFSIDKSLNQPIANQIAYEPLPNVLPVQSGAIALNTTSQQFQSKTKGFQAFQTEAVTLSDWKIEPKTIRFQTLIQAAKLDKGIYQIIFDALPLELQEPNWWSLWNANEGSLDGSKTNNLLSFLRGLRLSTTELVKQQKTAIARICYGIQRK
jgi:hypothetical protein